MSSSSDRTLYLTLFIIAATLLFPFLLYTGWALYDGLWGYPAKVERYEAYLQLQQDHPEDWQQRWADLSHQRGEPATAPDEMNRLDVVTQYVLSGVCGVFSLASGVSAIVFFLLWRRAERSLTRAGPVPRQRGPVQSNRA